MNLPSKYENHVSVQSRSAAALKKNLLLELLPHCSGKVLIQLGLRLIFRPQQYSQCDTFRKRATISHTNSTLRVACHLLIAADIIQQGKPIERDRRHKLIGGFVLPYTSVSLSLFFFYSCIKNAKKKKKDFFSSINANRLTCPLIITIGALSNACLFSALFNCCCHLGEGVSLWQPCTVSYTRLK